MIEIRGLDSLVPRALLAGLSEKALIEILFGIADAGRAEWVRLAGETYFTTRRDYIRGIQPVRLSPGVATISLVGDLPNMLEHGMESRDLHDTLLGPNVPLVPLGQRGKHPSKGGGEYRAIPFRHATPTAGGAVGQPMGRPYGKEGLVADAEKFGGRIYELAKQLNPTLVRQAVSKNTVVVWVARLWKTFIGNSIFLRVSFARTTRWISIRV